MLSCVCAERTKVMTTGFRIPKALTIVFAIIGVIVVVIRGWMLFIDGSMMGSWTDLPVISSATMMLHRL